MFQGITIWIFVILATFGSERVCADLPPLSYAEEAKYTSEVIKKYPSNDERHKFITESKKAFKLLEKIFEKFEDTFSSAPDNELWVAQDVFSVTQVFPIYKPFLKSKNTAIRLCAEDAVRFAKAWMVFVLLIEPLDEASDEEFSIALKNGQNSAMKFKSSYSNFLRSCLDVKIENK